MTDDEYKRLLSALASKHLRAPRVDLRRGTFPGEDAWLERFDKVSSLSRLIRAAASDPKQDEELLDLVRRRLNDESPVEMATSMMDDVGILDALDDAPSLVFGEFRRSALKGEDVEMLRRADFTDDEIEILLSLTVEYAHRLATERFYLPRPPGATQTRPLSLVLEDAVRALREATEKLPPEVPKKKRKLFNGISKLLGGSIVGIGNALVATGTILAPNPATGSIAIASGAGAVASFMAGIGDLRGE